MSHWNFTLELEIYTVYPWHCFKGCLDGGCEEKKHNPRCSQQLQTGTGRRASFKTVPPPRLSLGGQSELVSWWFVPDHIHGTSSSILMSRHKHLALAVTMNCGLWKSIENYYLIMESECYLIFQKFSSELKKFCSN